MQPQAYKHEDSRRILTEWISNIPFKTSKVIETKGHVSLGNHYHNKKDEMFYVLKGKVLCTLSGKRNWRSWLFPGETVFVSRGVAHSFEMYPDTIMLGAGTEPFDPNDEIPIE